jgi:hypothetical protein
MSERPACDADRVLAELTHGLQLPRGPGDTLATETSEALDILGHALELCDTPNALAVWREALWHGRLTADGRAAVMTMLEFINRAVSEGRQHLIFEICDCLAALISQHDRDRVPA